MTLLLFMVPESRARPKARRGPREPLPRLGTEPPSERLLLISDFWHKSDVFDGGEAPGQGERGDTAVPGTLSQQLLALKGFGQRAGGRDGMAAHAKFPPELVPCSLKLEWDQPIFPRPVGS